MFRRMLEKRYENLILIPLNILYFTLQCPFRLVVKHEQIQPQPQVIPHGNGFQHNLHKTLDIPAVQIKIINKIPQQIICAIFHLLGLFIYCNEVVQIHIARTSNNPVEYLRLFLGVCTFVHHINYIQLLWTKGPQMVRLAEHLATKFVNKYRQDQEGPFPKIGCILLPLIYISFALTSLGVLHETSSGVDPPSKVLMDLRSPFFNPMRCNGTNGTITFSGYETNYILNEFLSYLFLYTRLMLSYCTDIVIFATVLAVHRPIANFHSVLREYPIPDLEHFATVMKEYGNVCKLVDLLNAAFSRLMLTYVLEAFSFYSVYLKELTVFDGECVYMQCKMGFLFITFCTVFYLTAEISSLMEKSKFILINTNCIKSGGEEYNLYLMHLHRSLQLQSHNYGITGNGIFLINYSCVTTICSTLLTYFIISVQFQSRS